MARGAAMQRRLSQAFAQRQVGKRYVAVVAGRLERRRTRPDGWALIDLPLAADWPNRPRRIVDRERGKPSQTRWRVLAFDAARRCHPAGTRARHRPLAPVARAPAGAGPPDPGRQPVRAARSAGARAAAAAARQRIAAGAPGHGRAAALFAAPRRSEAAELCRRRRGIRRRRPGEKHAPFPAQSPQGRRRTGRLPHGLDRRCAAQPLPARRPTPAQTEGPFYPVSLPKDTDFDLLRNGALTTAAASRPGWKAASPTCRAGRSPAPRSRSGNATRPATTTTPATAARPIRRSRASAGSPSAPTAATASAPSARRPTAAARRTSTSRSSSAARELLTTQLYVAGDPHNERDFLWRSLGAAGPRRGHGAVRAAAATACGPAFPIVLAA